MSMLYKIPKKLQDKVDDLVKSSSKKDLPNNIVNLIANEYSNQGTILTMLTRIKKNLITDKILNEKEALDIALPDLTKERRRYSEDVLSNRKIKDIPVEDFKKLIILNDNPDVIQLLTYLMVTSGIRISEALEDNFKWTNKGILYKPKKKREDEKEVIIYPIVDNKTWYDNYKKFLKQRTNYDNKTLTRLLREHLDSINENLKPHSLRGLYTVYMLKFRNKERLIPNAYIKQILNHDATSASISYLSKYSIKGLNEEGDFMKVDEKAGRGLNYLTNLNNVISMLNSVYQ